MKGIIWCSNFNNGIKQLDKIKDDYEIMGIAEEVKRKGRNIYEIEFSNGDFWRVFKADNFRRGYKANISYIEADIPQEIVNTIIKPCTLSKPYQAINYFQ